MATRSASGMSCVYELSIKRRLRYKHLQRVRAVETVARSSRAIRTHPRQLQSPTATSSLFIYCVAKHCRPFSLHKEPNIRNGTLPLSNPPRLYPLLPVHRAHLRRHRWLVRLLRTRKLPSPHPPYKLPHNLQLLHRHNNSASTTRKSIPTLCR